MNERSHQQTLSVDKHMSLLAFDLLAFDLLAAIKARRIDPTPPCILPLPAEAKPAKLSVDGSPQPHWR